jgi:hypothetical protein
VLGDVGWAGWEAPRPGAASAGLVAASTRELDISDQTAALLVGMSAATIDRRLAGDRASLQLKGRRQTKPDHC